MRTRTARILVPLIGVLALVVPGTAVAQDGADPAAAPTAEPVAPAAQPAPAPAAQPAQSGPNEYSEGGVPTGTGEDEEPAPVQEPQEPASGDGSAPTGADQSAPTGSSAPAETSAETVTATETGLPRTGADTWIIALLGLALLGTGVLVRRAGTATRA